MSQRFCPYCGKQHRSTAKFCPETGKTLPAPRPVGNNQPAAPPAGLTGRLPPYSMLNNRFLILKKIGEGGMSAVYKAADTRLTGKIWAVKEMSESAITNPAERALAIQAFQQEATLLAQLEHENLPQVIDTFSENGRQYLVMEYVEGQTLEALLMQRAMPFSEADIYPWIMQLCSVLHYLHTQPRPIIFRDLKPSNIMITKRGQIKLIDFGIVRILKPGKKKDTMALGTAGYAAPEAASGQTDPRSDIYSLSVVIHELLTKHDPTTTIWDIPAARQLNPGVSAEWEQILQRGLEKQRERRWPDVQSMQDAFAQTATGQAGGDYQSSVVIQSGEGAVQIPTSRPTTRLLEAAAQLSTGQLTAAIGSVVLLTIAGVWGLSPIFAQYPIIWNNLALIAFVAPFTHAAVPKRWIAGITHAVISLAGGLTIAWRLQNPSYDIVLLIVGALVSAGFIEFWLHFLPQIKGTGTQDPWKRELGWYAFMAVIATALLYQIESQQGISILLWISAAVIGAAGWFFGDLAYQYLQNRHN